MRQVPVSVFRAITPTAPAYRTIILRAATLATANTRMINSTFNSSIDSYQDHHPVLWHQPSGQPSHMLSLQKSSSQAKKGKVILKPIKTSSSGIKRYPFNMKAFLLGSATSLLILLAAPLTYANPKPKAKQQPTKTCLTARKSRHSKNKSPTSHVISYANFDVIALYGNFSQMGYDYGKLEKKKLTAFIQSIKKAITAHRQQQHATDIANKLYQHYPERWQLFMQSMAKGADLPLSDIMLCNGFEHYAIFNDLPSHPHKNMQKAARQNKHHDTAFGCDELFFRDRSGKMNILRWYDYFKGHTNWRNKLSITVFHPEENDNKTTSLNQVAMITYLGTLNATTLLNNHGLFMALNNAIYSADRMPKAYQERHYDFAFSTIQLLDLFFKADNMQDVSIDMKNHRASMALIYSFASIRPKENNNNEKNNQNNVMMYEVTPEQTKVLQAENGAVVTNHFLSAANNPTTDDASWPFIKPRQTGSICSETYQRADNLQAIYRQLQSQQHPITTTALEQISNKAFTKGGVTRARTVMQLLIKNDNLYLKVPLKDDKQPIAAHQPHPFEKISLRTLFH